LTGIYVSGTCYLPTSLDLRESFFGLNFLKNRQNIQMHPLDDQTFKTINPKLIMKGPDDQTEAISLQLDLFVNQPTPFTTQPDIFQFDQNRRSSCFEFLPFQHRKSSSTGSLNIISNSAGPERQERNRKAAKKSRLKKKNYLFELEQTVADLTRKNKKLEATVKDLKIKLGENAVDL
jgi:bZIP transcription factor